MTAVTSYKSCMQVADKPQDETKSPIRITLKTTLTIIHSEEIALNRSSTKYRGTKGTKQQMKGPAQGQ